MTRLDALALALDPALARHAEDYQAVRAAWPGIEDSLPFVVWVEARERRAAEKARRELRACVAEGVRVEGGERRQSWRR